MLYFIIAISGACMVTALLSELLLNSGGVLTRRGRVLSRVVGVLFAMSGGFMLSAVWVLITN